MGNSLFFLDRLHHFQNNTNTTIIGILSFFLNRHAHTAAPLTLLFPSTVTWPSPVLAKIGPRPHVTPIKIAVAQRALANGVTLFGRMDEAAVSGIDPHMGYRRPPVGGEKDQIPRSEIFTAHRISR